MSDLSIIHETVASHVDYYRQAEERPVTRASVLADLRKDSQYTRFVAALGLDLDHPRAEASFRDLAWNIVRAHMNTSTGWWALSRGRGSQFVHQSWATVPEWAKIVNYRIEQRDEDQTKLNLACDLGAMAATLSGEWTWDPQHDEAGRLVCVEVWKR